MARLLITAGLPYANNELHLGHFRSTYITPDIYARFHRLLGDDVLFVCGTDEHGTPISLRAVKEGVNPETIAGQYYRLDLEVFTRGQISFDYFGRTTSPGHKESVQWFFSELLKRGFIFEKEKTLNYCEYDKRFLPDRYVRGTCRFCGYAFARGDECENCGRVLTEDDLLNPVCAICERPTIKKKTKNWFFDLEKFRPDLERWISSSEGLLPLYGKEYIMNQFLSKPLESFEITRDLDWGVEVPLKEARGKVFYVWFDAPVGYVSFVREYCSAHGKRWGDFWLDKDTKIVHFIGKNILYHHTLFWPAMLLGTGMRLPSAIPAAGLLTLQGRRLSKSSGWMITVKEFLDRFDNDFLRYYLLIGAPLSEDMEFKIDDFQKRVNGDLVDTLGNFVHRTLHFVATKFGSRVPEPATLEEEDRRMLSLITESREKTTHSIESFEFRSGIESVIMLAREGNRYLTKYAPWDLVRTDPKRAATVVYVAVQLVKAVAILSAAYLPGFSEKVWEMLTNGSKLPVDALHTLDTPVAPGTTTGEPKPVFRKVEGSQVSGFLEKFAKDTPTVSLGDFKKLDIRVATVVSAERVPRSKRLLKITVKVGDQKKNIVSGIGDQYSPESLVGRKIIVLNNLEPAIFMGIKSDGMLLAAEEDTKVSLLTVMEDVPDGTSVH